MLLKLRPGVSNINDQIEIDRKEVINSFTNLKQFRNYAAGRQDVTLTKDQQDMLKGVLGNHYSDNICGQVLSEHSNRLILDRITAKQDANGNDEEEDPSERNTVVPGQKEQEWVDAFWQRADLDDLQSRVHRNVIRDGNYCLMIVYDFDRKCVALHREPWWDGYTGVFIGYDTFGNKLYAVKEWDTPLGRRRTVYYEGAIERYLSVSGGTLWSPFILATDGVQGLNTTPGVQKGSEPIPIPFVDGDGYPMHIPFVHFTNPSDEWENYGTSIFSGGQIGAQDQINDIQYDICAAARMNGYQRMWSKGFKLQKINNKVIPPKTGPGVHYHADEATADWGVLQAGDMTSLIATYKMKVESFCRNTHTPYANITGNWPSGEALYRQEKPIYGMTLSRQKRNQSKWVEVIHRAMEMANVYDKADLDENVMLTSVYHDASDRDPLSLGLADQAFWQAAAFAVQAGMPLATFLKVAGWGEDAVTGITTDIANQIEKGLIKINDPNSPDPADGTAPQRTTGNPTNPTPKESTTVSKNKTAVSKPK